MILSSLTIPMGTRASCGTRAAVPMVRHSQPVDKRAGESNQTLLVGPITCVDVCVCYIRERVRALLLPPGFGTRWHAAFLWRKEDDCCLIFLTIFWGLLKWIDNKQIYDGNFLYLQLTWSLLLPTVNVTKSFKICVESRKLCWKSRKMCLYCRLKSNRLIYFSLF